MTSNDEGSMQWQSPVCQCCLSSTQRFYKEVASEYFWMGEKEVYEDMLLKVFSISLTSNEKDPRICELCVNKLRDASTFKKQVLRSQETLASRVVDDTLDNLIKDENGIETLAKSMDPFYRDDHNIDDTFEGTSEPMTPEVEVKEEPHTSENLRISDEETDDVKPCQPADSKRVTRSSEANTGTEKPKQKRDKWKRENALKSNTVELLKNSDLCPFKWHKNKYQCFCCKDTFADMKFLRQHTGIHTWEDIKSVITRYNSVLFHKVDMSSLSCKICLQSQMDVKILREHLIKLHSVSFNEDEGDLLIPFKLESGYECAICSESFLVFHKLNIHMNKHYQNYICETCGAGFTNQSNLREHSLIHDGKLNVCEMCKIEFANAYQKKQHDSSVHQKCSTRVCPYCSERFSGHYGRLLHMVTVHGEKRPEFKCSSCERVFLRKYLLNAHVRKFHMREKKHECEVCSIKFFNKSDLVNHAVTHTGVKNFVCSFCGKSYSRKGTLTWHLKSHAAAVR
ncbi:hypothetical protein JYU34_017901 [Plutella xylostella]|uniref:Uncharacterized protein n=1 Tax=Plutella xylostella TaxID=51655 RepID=A0ABQ7PZ92_PLUXY|nr:hypothetical protein JYU34_017901 [Plutella xylostella]